MCTCKMEGLVECLKFLYIMEECAGVNYITPTLLGMSLVTLSFSCPTLTSESVSVYNIVYAKSIKGM